MGLNLIYFLGGFNGGSFKPFSSEISSHLLNSESLFLLIVNNTTEVIETKTKSISKIIIVFIWSLDSDSTSEA